MKDGCRCHSCLDQYDNTIAPMKLFMRINLACPVCLRRECPHTEHHDNACTAVPPGSGIKGTAHNASEAA